jgi:hypothetical protein
MLYKRAFRKGKEVVTFLNKDKNVKMEFGYKCKTIS